MGKKQIPLVLCAVLVLVLIIVLATRGNTNSQIDKDISKSQKPMTSEPAVSLTILKEGSGPGAIHGDQVSVNYTGTLADGTVFDSNVDPKFQHVEPFTFVLGTGMVIPGWDAGVLGMRKGEKRHLVVPPSFAYGSAGIPGVIPGDSTLEFDVEMIAIGQ